MNTAHRLQSVLLAVAASAAVQVLSGCSCNSSLEPLDEIPLPEPNDPWCEPVEWAVVDGGSASNGGEASTIVLRRVGSSISHGDFDGDGWFDIAFGAPLSETDGRTEAGAVVICWGQEETGGGAPPGAGWFNLDGCTAYAVTGLDAGWRWGAELAALPTSKGHTLVVAAPGRPVGQESWARTPC